MRHLFVLQVELEASLAFGDHVRQQAQSVGEYDIEKSRIILDFSETSFCHSPPLWSRQDVSARLTIPIGGRPLSFKLEQAASFS